MKQLLIILFLPFVSLTQQWQTILADDYLPGPGTPPYGFNGHVNAFKINPYDSTVWIGMTSYLLHFDRNGDLQIYDENHNAEFDNFAQFDNITFTEDYVYASNPFYGLYQFDGTSWTKVSSVNDGVFLTSDIDTVWMMRQTNNFFKFTDNGTPSFGSVSLRSFAAKNGIYWSGGGYLTRYFSNNTYDFVSSDTVDYLLDNENNVIRFSPNDNRFYTCGDRGISIALNRTFIDTITPYNTTGMPQIPIVELEFDSQDNIWAGFSSSSSSVSELIAYLDRSTGEWTVYDSNNSPLGTVIRGIEVDPCDNLWAREVGGFKVLKSGNCEMWLGEQELSLNTSIYPNPSSGVFSIETDQHYSIIEIRDLSGRLISRYSKGEQIRVNESGTYLLQLRDNDSIIETSKIVVQ